MPRVPIAVALLALASAAAGTQDDESVKARLGKFVVEERGNFTRLVYDGNLIGLQVNRPYLSASDAPALLGLGSPWEALALAGVHTRWNPRLEPLAFYHRCGPVGAAFHHLRTRDGGRYATAPVGVVGMEAGTTAAYALRGQPMTFYGVRPEHRDLVEHTDRYFTYVRDARDRGARLDLRNGPPRQALAADADRRFALLLVDLVGESHDPGDRLTLEAVRVYVDRTRPDGVVALHASNGPFNLEPVVERIARELKLSARVWHDDAANRPGMFSTSWVVLARSDADLGPLAEPTLDQILTFGTRNEQLARLIGKHGPDADALTAVLDEWGGRERESLTPSRMSVRHGPQAADLFRDALRLRVAGKTGRDATLGALAQTVCGPMFRPLAADPRVELRTDAHRPALPSAAPPRK